MNYTIRIGTKEDLPFVHKLIKELAIYENAENEVSTTPEQMLVDGFGENPCFSFFVAQLDDQIIGTAIYYISYSTWKGRSLYLEDLIVNEKHRRKGVGILLFDRLIEEAKKRKAHRFLWQVLDWNQPAIDFYKKYDSIFEENWINCKLTKEQMDKL